MTLRHLKIYKEVCETLSITQTAKKLYIAQPAVSQVVKELEQHYKTKLFDRISRKLYITEDGKKLLEYATHILSLFDEMEQTIGSTDYKGTLKIGSSITIGNYDIPLLVKEFKTVYKKADIRVCINSSKIIEEKILNNELDFALIEGTVHSSQIHSEIFRKDKLVIFCSTIYSQKNPKDLEELIKEPFLMREKGSGTREWFDSVLESQGLNVAPIWESTSTRALIKGVEENLGISVLPYRLIQDNLKQNTIEIINIEGLNLIRNYHIIYHKNKYLSALSKKFIDMTLFKNMNK